jgi:hypothetical protein
MIEIGRSIVSFDIFEEHFLCDLQRCKGACCVEGDSGALLTVNEAGAIERDYHLFQENLPESHKAEVRKQGYFVIDFEGDTVTPLVNNRQCAYSFHDKNNILKCAIEKTFSEGKTSFKKPVSCHLFPIRITQYKRFDAVNYQQLDICKAGRECGRANKHPLYKFLKEPLIRKYGEDWYAQLEEAANYVKNKK